MADRDTDPDLDLVGPDLEEERRLILRIKVVKVRSPEAERECTRTGMVVVVLVLDPLESICPYGLFVFDREFGER